MMWTEPYSKTEWITDLYTVVQKNAPTLADYNYELVQSILIIIFVISSVISAK